MKPSDDKNQSADWITQARRRLAAKRGKKPETKAAQIWALWPEIRLALAEGQRVATIRLWLQQEAEIDTTADTLRSYLARCRRKERPGSKWSGNETTTHRVSGHDPMALARRALDKSRFDIRQIHGDGDPSDQDLI